MAKFKRISLNDVVRIASPSTISEDGQAATVIFENFKISLGGYKSSPRVTTRVVSLTIPIIESDTDILVQQDITGSVIIDAGARAILVAHLGGKPNLVNLSNRTCETEEFRYSFDSILPAGIDYQATLFLLAERDSDDESVGAYLAVEALDIELKQSDYGKKVS